MTKQKKNQIIEIVLYALFGALAIWGLVYIILGLLANNLPVPEAKNALKDGNAVIEANFGLGFFGWGLILFGVFAVAVAITFTYFARDVDKSYEKNQRRAARLKRNKVEDNKEEVIDAKVE